MYEILMVCTGNICRSPMAEGILKHLLTKNMENLTVVSSAGTDAIDGNSAEPHVVQVMEEYGIDLSIHHARLIDEQMVKDATLIFVMENGHKEYIEYGYGIDNKDKIILLTDFSSDKNLDKVFDPYGGSVDTYRQCATIIEECLENALKYIEHKTNYS